MRIVRLVKCELSRRGFIAGSAALALQPTALAAQVPLLRFGVLSDIHINKNRWNRRPDGSYRDAKFLRSLEFFRDVKVDAVMCCGDLADFGLSDELQIVADSWYEVFPDNRRPDGAVVEKLFHYGDHDIGSIHERIKDPAVYGYESKDEIDAKVIGTHDRKAVWERCFKEPWSPIVHKKVRGYDFILCNFTVGETGNKWGNNTPGIEEYLSTLELSRDRPFFYSQHRVYRGTVGRGKIWGQDDGRSTTLLSNYPNCIAFCGHAHSAVTNEDNIWQGAFTAIEIPSLNYLGSDGHLPCHENGQKEGKIREFPCQMAAYPFWKSAQGCLVDVYPDRVVINRLDVRIGEPVASAWVVPLHSSGLRPFDIATRESSELAPIFSSGAEISVRHAVGKDRNGVSTNQMIVSFTPALSTSSSPRAYDYAVRIIGKGKTVEKRVFSPNHFRPESQESQKVTCVFATDELPSATFDIEVRPVAFFGKEGAGIVRKGVSVMTPAIKSAES